MDEDEQIDGGPSEEESELLPGGDFIAPDVSPEVRQFIQSCRRLMYSEEFTPIIKQALTGANSLAESAAPVLMEIIGRAQDKMGPLSDEDVQTVATHLAGTIVSTAKILGDPEAEDGQAAVEQIVGLIDEMTSGAQEQEAMPPQEEPMAGALAQLR
jgi:hypothetical protein